jgi:uncharacterized protein (TIGR02646 family)
MRYVKKVNTPQFFIEDTDPLDKWNDYSDEKIKLREYILKEEQNYLCIYCESKVTKENSHLEHIKPKSLNINLTFDYNNIVVSCNGTTFNPSDDKKQYNCGHKKEAKHEEYKFLDPTRYKDIGLYFIYDYDDFKIYPSGKDDIKAKYMIDILQLNSGSLINARRNKYKSFNKRVKKIRDIEERKACIKKKLYSEDIEFVSFFRYKYINIINKTTFFNGRCQS